MLKPTSYLIFLSLALCVLFFGCHSETSSPADKESENKINEKCVNPIIIDDDKLVQIKDLRELFDGKPGRYFATQIDFFFEINKTGDTAHVRVTRKYTPDDVFPKTEIDQKIVCNGFNKNPFRMFHSPDFAEEFQRADGKHSWGHLRIPAQKNGLIGYLSEKDGPKVEWLNFPSEMSSLTQNSEIFSANQSGKKVARFYKISETEFEFRYFEDFGADNTQDFLRVRYQYLKP